MFRKAMHTHLRVYIYVVWYANLYTLTHDCDQNGSILLGFCWALFFCNVFTCTPHSWSIHLSFEPDFVFVRCGAVLMYLNINTPTRATDARALQHKLNTMRGDFSPGVRAHTIFACARTRHATRKLLRHAYSSPTYARHTQCNVMYF